MLSLLKRALGIGPTVDVVDDMILGSNGDDLSELRRALRAEPSLSDRHTQTRLNALFDDIERERVKAPLLPQAAMVMLEAADAAEANIDVVAERVGRDPVIASRLVKLASSPWYGSPRIDGIHSALVRIGKAGMRTLAIDVSFEATLRPGPLLPIGERIVSHARATSNVARMLAPMVNESRELAALAGLTHGLGGLAILRRLESGAKEQPVPGFVVFLCVRLFHPKVSALTAKQFGFPKEICDALAHHHDKNVNDESAILPRLLSFADRVTPGEPGARACEIGEGLVRSRLPLPAEHVIDQLSPMFASLVAAPVAPPAL